MTPGRRLRWAELWPQYGLSPDAISTWAPAVLDVGFGNGASTIHLAEHHPDRPILAIDVHEPGIVTLMEAIAARGIGNIRIVRDDLVDVIGHVAPLSLERVQILFPDPWPKAAQQHRRLVRPAVVDTIVAAMAPGGVLHLATDWADYAEVMRSVCDRRDLDPVDTPDRAVTKYEQRGSAEGRPATDLAYRRRVPSLP